MVRGGGPKGVPGEHCSTKTVVPDIEKLRVLFETPALGVVMTRLLNAGTGCFPKLFPENGLYFSLTVDGRSMTVGR